MDMPIERTVKPVQRVEHGLVYEVRFKRAETGAKFCILRFKACQYAFDQQQPVRIQRSGALLGIVQHPDGQRVKSVWILPSCTACPADNCLVFFCVRTFFCILCVIPEESVCKFVCHS